MFPAQVYVQRRKELKSRISSGVLLFLGNDESPMNYPANVYPFRQDSTFLYYWGLDVPGLAALIDVDGDREVVFGDDLSVEDIVWTGPQPRLAEWCEKIGVRESLPASRLTEEVRAAIRRGQRVHILPPYRPEHRLQLQDLLGVHPSRVQDYVSEDFIRAVVAQRSVKSPEEIEQIEAALEVTHEVHTRAMQLTRPGMFEFEVVGAMEGIALARSTRFCFPPIFSVHGETLHNPHHLNRIGAGDLLVCDCGVETPMHYASDITRTFPASGRFSERQKAVYEIVLRAQQRAIDAIRPGVPYRDIHLLAARTMAEGLRDLGLMKGDVEEAVQQGAHALFFPHGLGHMLGLDVHDMENLGEDYVGYDEEFRRSDQFGLAYLRMAKRLQPGYVLTVEPGIYFIPELIAQWKEKKRFTEFIDYSKVDEFADFGGVRIEDDVLVTEDGHRVLGKPIPKAVEEIEAAMVRR
jgi:Xaa-Pro aminopeptidase